MSRIKRKLKSESPKPMEISSPELMDLKTDQTYFFYDLNPFELEDDLGFSRLTLKTEEILDKPQKNTKPKKRKLPSSFLIHKIKSNRKISKKRNVNVKQSKKLKVKKRNSKYKAIKEIKNK